MTCQIGTSLCCQYCNDLLQAGKNVIQMVLKGSPILNHSVTFGDFLSGIQKNYEVTQTITNSLQWTVAMFGNCQSESSQKLHFENPG